MALFFFIFFAAFLFMIWLAIKSTRRTAQELKKLTLGEMFEGFNVDTEIHFLDQILALDKLNRSVVLVRCTYWAPHPFDNRMHNYTTSVRLEACDIRSVEAYCWSERVPNSFNFLLNSKIPESNSSQLLSISGHSGSIGPFIEEVAKCLGVPARLDMPNSR